MIYDVIIVGGGIVGLSTGFQLQKKQPDLKVAILEKENTIAKHQTGHNSGVIHSGIYYKPDSLKALNCRNGYEKLIKFCQDNDVNYELCGKVIVAIDKNELITLNNLFERGRANGIKGIRKAKAEEIKEIEPYVSCISGIIVPETGIVNYTKAAEKYAQLFGQSGGVIFCNEKINQINNIANTIVIRSDNNEWKTRFMVNCAGLYADHIATLSGAKHNIRIIPFRGEYYLLKPTYEYLVTNLIYPVPNPEFPFLGVHFTKMIDGGVEAGPNAVLAFAKEGYKKSDIRFKELFDILKFKGFHQIALKYWREGLAEMYRSFSKEAFVHSMQKMIPEIQSDFVITGGSGVRAQACDKSGNLLDDFYIIEDMNFIHVLNAPSPAATASLSIGENIVNKILTKLVI